MDSAVIDDLKQFITTTVSQQLKYELSELSKELYKTLDQQLDQKLDEKLDEKLGQQTAILRAEMQDGFAGIAAIIESHNDQLDDHERRIGRLEGRTA